MALSELTKRTLSAAVLMPVAVGALMYGGIAFWALATLMIAIGAGEWACLHGACRGEHKIGLTATVLSAVFPMIVMLLDMSAADALVVSNTHTGQALGLLALLSVGLAAYGMGKGSKPHVKMAAGAFYCGLAGIALVWLRGQDPSGMVMVLFVLAAVWATDIGAYFGGRTIGGPKIAPKISPKKTWAGLISGAICAAICSALIARYTSLEMSPFIAAPLGAMLAVVAQAGDFLESHVKRVAGAKDSSNLIPGHGGVLDRVDGILPTAPLMALIWLLL